MSPSVEAANGEIARLGLMSLTGSSMHPGASTAGPLVSRWRIDLRDRDRIGRVGRARGS